MQPKNTLFVKVKIKNHPYSQKPISISLSAAMFPAFNASQAILFSDLPLNSNSYVIEHTIKNMQKQSNTENVSVKFATNLLKILNNQ